MNSVHARSKIHRQEIPCDLGDEATKTRILLPSVVACLGGATAFRERIEAWAAGPVIPSLYEEHRGKFSITAWPRGDDRRLHKDDCETIDAVIKFYGKKTAQQLSDLTHREAPWVDARSGVPDGVRSNSVITNAALDEYYGSLRK